MNRFDYYYDPDTNVVMYFSYRDTFFYYFRSCEDNSLIAYTPEEIARLKPY